MTTCATPKVIQRVLALIAKADALFEAYFKSLKPIKG